MPEGFDPSTAPILGFGKIRPPEEVRILYVAGPYRSTHEYGVSQNIRRAESMAAELWRRGYVVFCPHKNSAGFGGLISDESFLLRDLELLALCHGIVMGYRWQESKGSREELRFAEARGLHVYYNLSELHGPGRPSPIVGPSAEDCARFGWNRLGAVAGDPSSGITLVSPPVGGPSLEKHLGEMRKVLVESARGVAEQIPFVKWHPDVDALGPGDVSPCQACGSSDLFVGSITKCQGCGRERDQLGRVNGEPLSGEIAPCEGCGSTCTETRAEDPRLRCPKCERFRTASGELV